VNLSARQLQNSDIVDKVFAILEETAINPRYLEFEITESIAFNDTESVIDILNTFRQAGISIAIDDFGTEYSSLNYLKQLPVDRIKIAMPFVHGIDTNEKDEAITKAILVLAKSMGLKVVAEGVETQKQFQFLSQRMCDDVQGFFFYRPMPARDIEKLLIAEQNMMGFAAM
jgi:EAL domain-containing protein (putative c-di-GMP-specific phosphodiesterase class I)